MRPAGPGRGDADLGGVWTGAGAVGFGLAGGVGREELTAVLGGRRPGDGRPLVARRGGVAGYDLTFTAPKSVSVLFALSVPEVGAEVLAAHDAAVEEAMGYVARRAAAVRRGSGDERRTEPVAGVVGAAFAHGLSRAHDPHLHTHVVVANLGHGADGRWTALDGRGLHAHAVAAGDLYGADLRHRLTQALGVEWVTGGRGTYELAGVDPAVVGAFSTRGSEIRAELAASGRSSSRAGRVAWARTRDPKDALPPTSSRPGGACRPKRSAGRPEGSRRCWHGAAGGWALRRAPLRHPGGRPGARRRHPAPGGRRLGRSPAVGVPGP